MIYGFCEKIWTIVVYVNRSRTHVLQNTTLFTSLFDNAGGVNRLYAIVSNSIRACAIMKGGCIEFDTAVRAYSRPRLSFKGGATALAELRYVDSSLTFDHSHRLPLDFIALRPRTNSTVKYNACCVHNNLLL